MQKKVFKMSTYDLQFSTTLTDSHLGDTAATEPTLERLLPATLKFYGVLAECLYDGDRNDSANPTLWLCDPDNLAQRGYRAILRHDMAVGLWALRYFDDMYWLRKSTSSLGIRLPREHFCNDT